MSQIINVSSTSGLLDAIANAKGGETILLASGNYDDLSLTEKSGFDLTFPSELTIASADIENPAVFSSLHVREAANLTFDGITFDYEFQEGDKTWTRATMITDSSNITIRNSTFDGDLAQGMSETDDGYGTAVGLLTTGTTGLVIENNEFFDYHRAMITYDSSDIVITGNDIHSIRSDGMNFAEVSNVLIEGNYIHDFRASPLSSDHQDMIQFHTQGTDTPSSDITIRGNHFDIGQGSETQTLFLRNEEVDSGRAGEELFYSNILIEENVIVNGHLHGITVGETDGLIIRQNSVLHADGNDVDGADSSVEIPRINVASDSVNVAITNNITSAINGDSANSGWIVSNNAIVQDQDPLGEGYYGDVFITSSLSTVGTVHGYLAIPGGALDQMSAGASSTHNLTNTSELTARFHITSSEDSAALYHFDAANSTDGGSDLPEGTIFTWTFADGTTRTGEQVTHAFESSGLHEATLAVTLPNGQVDETAVTVSIPNSNLVSYDTSNGLITHDDDSSQISASSAQTTHQGINTSQQGVALQIDREHVDGIIGQNEFAISMTLQGNRLQDSGEIMRLHGSFILQVDRNGELYLRTFTEDGEQTQLTTDNANINDGATHNIDINFMDGVLSINVDGETRASTTMDTPLRGADGHNLVFGNPWNADNFESTITAIDITVNANDFSETALLQQEETVQVDLIVPPTLVQEEETPLEVQEGIWQRLFDENDPQESPTGQVPDATTGVGHQTLIPDNIVPESQILISEDPASERHSANLANPTTAFENQLTLSNADDLFG